jgi:hypothetical protein
VTLTMSHSAAALSLSSGGLREMPEKPRSRSQIKLFDTRGFPSPSFNEFGFTKD